MKFYLSDLYKNIVGEECLVNSYIKNIIWSIFHLRSIQITFWFGIMSMVFHIFDNKESVGKILPGNYRYVY